MRFEWLARLLGEALALYLRLVAATARVSGEVTREQVVLAFWHEYNLAAVVVALSRRRDLKHVSFSTQAFRGVVITTLLERVNVRVVPLPDESDRSAARDLAVRMARLAAEGYSLVVTPDGPFGPHRVAKPGAVIVAQASGLPIQPWAIQVRPSVRIVRRWDRHLIPLPFSRLRVVSGHPTSVPGRQRPRSQLRVLQEALDSISA